MLMAYLLPYGPDGQMDYLERVVYMASGGFGLDEDELKVRSRTLLSALLLAVTHVAVIEAHATQRLPLRIVI